MSNPFAQARYVLAAHNARQLPPDPGLEVAFPGRSTAGHSPAPTPSRTRRGLPRASRPPGRPRHRVFFDVSPSSAAATEPRHLVDLPGYGYAKVPKDLQAHWQAFIDEYFRTRQALKGLVVVMDIRHPLKDYDRQMLGYAVSRGLPAHAILTKADKLGRGAQGNAMLAVRKQMQAEYGDAVSAQVFSGESKQGVDEVRGVVARWLGLREG